MKQHPIIFNVMGLTIAMIFAFSGCGQIQICVSESTLLWTGLVILLVGGSSIANLAGRGLALWPTITMIVGYCISVLVLPFAIWGIIALVKSANGSAGNDGNMSKWWPKNGRAAIHGSHYRSQHSRP